MADFNIAFEKIVFNEGGYVNDPDDAGGETYMGISRRAHPNAIIWKHIDKITAKYKTAKTITKYLKQNKELTQEIKALYKSDYWAPLKLSVEKSQRLANQIFDSAVNRGVSATLASLKRVKNEMDSVKS